MLKKFFRNNLVCLLIIAIIMTCIFQGFATDSRRVSDVELNSQIPDQADAIEAYNDIIENLKSGKLNDDVYAGAYVDGTKIIIMLTDLSDEIKNDFLMATDKPYAISFEQAEYSLKYLNEQLSETVNMLSDYPITSYGFYESRNKCFIEIDEDYYNNFISEMPTLYSNNKLPIVFEPGEPCFTSVFEPETPQFTNAASDIKGGMRVTTSTGFMTVGFCGYYGIRDAILTAGHGVVEGEETSYGRVIQRKYQNNQRGDSAIIYTNSDYNITNEILDDYHGSLSVRTVYSSIPENSNMHAYGAANGAKSGVVEATNVSMTDSLKGTTICGLTRCNLSYGLAKSGDSGGPVFYLLGSYQVAACGIIHGSNWPGDEMYFVPFEYITPSFNPATVEW